MKPPPQDLIDKAIFTARQSPCSKSKRGVVIFRRVGDDDDFELIAAAFNSPPAPFYCHQRETLVQLFAPSDFLTTRKLCAERCRDYAVHAEERAIRMAIPHVMEDYKYELLHIKVDSNGLDVNSRGPECAPCSRAIMDCGFIETVWLIRDHEGGSRWDNWTAEEFHEASMLHSGIPYARDKV